MQPQYNSQDNKCSFLLSKPLVFYAKNIYISSTLHWFIPMPPSIQNSETSRKRKLVAFYNDRVVKDRFFYRRKRLLSRNLNCSYTCRDCDLVVPVFNYLILRNSSSMSLKVIKLVESKVINGRRWRYSWSHMTEILVQYVDWKYIYIYLVFFY